jgi:hypothetical protein
VTTAVEDEVDKLLGGTKGRATDAEADGLKQVGVLGYQCEHGIAFGPMYEGDPEAPDEDETTA